MTMDPETENETALTDAVAEIDINADTDAPLCAVCSQLDLRTHLLQGSALPRSPLGPLSRILSTTDCALCGLLSNLFQRQWFLDRFPELDHSLTNVTLGGERCGKLDMSNPTPKAEKWKEAQRLVVSVDHKPVAVHYAQQREGMYLQMELQVMEESAKDLGRVRTFHGRKVSEVVDIQLCKEWISGCEKGHAGDCENVWWWAKDEEADGGGALPPNMRVIDVDEMRLVKASDIPGGKFTCLSYMWGGPGDAYWTTKANVAGRLEEGGLDIDILPATISDTILLCRELGEKYLWVDALCIIQDDLDDKMPQVRCMDLIYGKAFLTIYAAGGTSCREPLPGFRPGTRKVKQHVETIQGLKLAAPLPSYGESLVRSTWNTRGWTYQERTLGRRRLFFTEDQMYWECRRDLYSEDVICENNSRYAVYPAQTHGRCALLFPFNYRPTPYDSYLAQYTTVIQEYTRRELSFESDILNAVTGVTNIFAKGYEKDKGSPEVVIQFGIPTTEIESGMLWQHAADCAQERRVVEGVATPSWSWAGWRGGAEYRTVGFNPATQAAAVESFVREYRLTGMDGITRTVRNRRAVGGFSGKMEDYGKYPAYKGVGQRGGGGESGKEGKEASSSIQRAGKSISGLMGELREGLFHRRKKDKKEHHDIPSASEKTPSPPLPLHSKPGTLTFLTHRRTFRVHELPERAMSLTSSGGQVPYRSPYHSMYAIMADPSPLPTLIPTTGPIQVGSILLPKGIPQEELEFIVLSRANGSYVDAWDPAVFGRMYETCLLNVMAVKRVFVEEDEKKEGEEKEGEKTEADVKAGTGGEYMERVGLGVILEGVWCGDGVEEVVVRLC